MTSATETVSANDIAATMQKLGQNARVAASSLAQAPTEVKNAALLAAAKALRTAQPAIITANQADVADADARGISNAMRDRLILNPARIEAMAVGLEKIVDLPDPVGRILSEWHRPNGLNFQRIAVPLGVIGIIFESRPNVAADAGALCLKSGNAAILRGGSESYRSVQEILKALQTGLKEAGIDANAIQMIPTTDRAAVGHLLTMSEYVDVIVPRGGKGLIERVSAESRIPVFKHLDGLCHTYIHKDANLNMARDVVINAKMRRTGICGATETILIDEDILASHAPTLVTALADTGCEIRGDAKIKELCPDVLQATEEDWDTEYLDAIVSIRAVSGIDAAITHIETHGSHHTDAIITDNPKVAEVFLNGVDSAITIHNASTQFADGGEFGFGAEIGISTGKFHARGPVGLEQLTSYKYKVRGNGQTRPA